MSDFEPMDSPHPPYVAWYQPALLEEKPWLYNHLPLDAGGSDCRKLDKGGRDYELTIPYDDDADLEKSIDELIRHIENTADLRHYSVEDDVRSVDDPDRAW